MTPLSPLGRGVGGEGYSVVAKPFVIPLDLTPGSPGRGNIGQSMASHARFAAVVLPQYFVLGRLFAMMPPAIAGCLCGLMGLMMGLWTAFFVAGYRFF